MIASTVPPVLSLSVVLFLFEHCETYSELVFDLSADFLGFRVSTVGVVDSTAMIPHLPRGFR